MDLKVTAYRDLDDSRLQRAWPDAVQFNPPTSIFCTREWCQSWAEIVGQDAEPFVLVAESKNRVEGVWPLCIARSDGVRWVKFLGSDRVKGDHMDFLCDPNRRSVVGSTFLKFILQHNDAYDGMLLDGVACDSPSHRLLSEWAQQNRWRTVEREIQTLPFIQLPEKFDAYLSTLSHKRRSAVRRSRRKLAVSEGEIRLSWGKCDLNQVLSEFFRLHVQRWNWVGQESNFADSSMRSFLTAFCTHATVRDWFRAYSLIVKGRTEGVLLAFHFNGVASFYQIGRDPSSTVLNSGMVLMTASIEQAISESMRRYDFLRGDEPYKSRLAKSRSTQSTVMIGFRRPATSVIAKEQLAQRMKRLAHRMLGDERWSKLKDRLRNRPVRRIRTESTEGADS